MGDRPDVYWYVGETGPNATGLTVHPPAEILSAEEMGKFEQMRFLKRREEWLLGRLTLKKLLKNCVPGLAEVDFTDLTIGNQPRGAPFVSFKGKILDIPVSLSHRQGTAAAAVSLYPGIGIGIDLEWVEERAESFYTDYFTPTELAILRAGQDDQTAWIGTLIWSAKEAMLKALGHGLRVDTRSVEVLRIVDDLNTGWNTLEIQAPAFEGTRWHGTWRRSGNLVCTIALLNSPGCPNLRQIDGIN